jgi:hypothetical protein
MKKYLLVLLFTITFSTSSYAFDYHGIKSGMTKDQISKVLSGLGVNKVPDEVSYLSDVQLKGVAIMPYILSMEYDYEGKLYKLELTYMGHRLPEGVNTLAFHQALTEKYKAEIEFERGGEFKLQVHHEPQTRTLHGASGIQGTFVGDCLTV